MSRCFHPRTVPGEPVDWRDRAIVGGAAPCRSRGAVTFLVGISVGVGGTLAMMLVLAATGVFG